jgi:hypothetical protein
MRAQVRPFVATDAVLIRLQPSQIGQMGAFEEVRDLKHGMMLAEMGPAWTIERADGEVLMCAGLGEVFPGVQATAWALIGTLNGSHRAAIQAMRSILRWQPYQRIEALARADVPAEGQFLRLAGFSWRCDLPKWGPLSETYQLYERVK